MKFFSKQKSAPGRGFTPALILALLQRVNVMYKKLIQYIAPRPKTTNRGAIESTMPNLVRGFTIIEVLVSITIFLIVVTVSMGALMHLVNSDKKARAVKIAMDNLNLALESISRNMRMGSVYHCGEVVVEVVV